MQQKKLTFILLAFLLILTLSGCSGDEKVKEVNKKEVIYEEVVLSDTLGEEHISGIDLNNKNEIVLCSEEDSSKYLVLGENGEVKKEIGIEFDGRGDMFTIDKNKIMYILSEIPRRDDNKNIVGIDRKLLSYNGESGSITEDNVIGALNDNVARSTDEMTIKIEADSEGNIYALKLKGSIDVYDSNLNLIKTIDSVGYKDIEIDEEDALLALHKNIDKKALDKIDTNTFKTIWTKEYNDTDAPERIYYNKNTKSLYGVNSYWIVRYDSEGNLTNRFLNTGELSEIDFIVDLIVDDNEEVYLIAEVEENYKLIKYTKSDYEAEANSVQEDKTEITIELWKDYENFFTNTAKKFEKEYPHIDVIVKTNSNIEESQYKEKLNTELMAGKGPDIIFSDYNNYVRTFMENNILVNLDEMIKRDRNFNIDDYNQRIIDLVRYKSNLYTMPINYAYFYGLILNEELLDKKGISLDDNMTWRDVYNLSERLNENSKEKIYVIPKMEDNDLFKQIIWQDIDYYMDWEKKDARFDSKEFVNALELLRGMMEDDIMHPDISCYNILTKYIYIDMDLSNIAIYPGQIGAYEYISIFGSYFNNFKAVSGPRGEYTGNRQFPSRSLSINANSECKEEAWEFIKFVLTEEIQLSNESYFSINNKANEMQIEEVFNFQETYKQQMEKHNEYFATEEDIEEVDRIIGNLNSHRIGDPFYDVIYKEVQSFLSGEKTAEEVAKQLQNKAEIYLLE